MILFKFSNVSENSSVSSTSEQARNPNTTFSKHKYLWTNFINKRITSTRKSAPIIISLSSISRANKNREKSRPLFHRPIMVTSTGQRSQTFLYFSGRKSIMTFIVIDGRSRIYIAKSRIWNPVCGAFCEVESEILAKTALARVDWILFSFFFVLCGSSAACY